MLYEYGPQCDQKLAKMPLSYVHGRDIIKALKVCNDRTVHEAKLASDFLPMSVFEKKKTKIYCK